MFEFELASGFCKINDGAGNLSWSGLKSSYIHGLFTRVVTSLRVLVLNVCVYAEDL